METSIKMTPSAVSVDKGNGLYETRLYLEETCVGKMFGRTRAQSQERAKAVADNFNRYTRLAFWMIKDAESGLVLASFYATEAEAPKTAEELAKSRHLDDYILAEQVI